MLSLGLSSNTKNKFRVSRKFWRTNAHFVGSPYKALSYGHALRKLPSERARGVKCERSKADSDEAESDKTKDSLKLMQTKPN